MPASAATIAEREERTSDQVFWKIPDGRIIGLISPEDLQKLPDGATLLCIDGRSVVKGQDYFSPDTHQGFVAYGVPVCERCGRPFG